jgi:prepilin-type N-terminal cleavage/methylation domain-containing protein
MNKFGFTLIELIIAVAILGTIFSAGLYGITRLNSAITEFSAHDIETMLGSAARRARSGVLGTSWGIYIPYDEQTRRASQVILFSGDSYATRDQNQDIISVFNEDIQFTSVDFSGSGGATGNDHEIVFEVFSGQTTQYGSITIETFESTRTISIPEIGIPVREF